MLRSIAQQCVSKHLGLPHPSRRALSGAPQDEVDKRRHCEELLRRPSYARSASFGGFESAEARSAKVEAIQGRLALIAGLLRSARNDEFHRSRGACASGSSFKRHENFCLERTGGFVHERTNKGGEAPKGAYHPAASIAMRRVLSGGRSPSGASPRRLSRRSTARNSVQAALHAMKCEGITFAFSHRA